MTADSKELRQMSRMIIFQIGRSRFAHLSINSQWYWGRSEFHTCVHYYCGPIWLGIDKKPAK